MPAYDVTVRKEGPSYNLRTPKGNEVSSIQDGLAHCRNNTAAASSVYK